MKQSKLIQLSLFAVLAISQVVMGADIDRDYEMISRDGYFLSNTKLEEIAPLVGTFLSNWKLKDAVAVYLGNSQYDLGRERISILQDYLKKTSPKISCIDAFDSGTVTEITHETPPGLFAGRQVLPCHVKVTFEPITVSNVDCIFWRDTISPISGDPYHACYLQHHHADSDVYTVVQVILKPDSKLDKFHSMDVIKISGTSTSYVSDGDYSGERIVLESLENASLLVETPVHFDGVILSQRMPSRSDYSVIYDIGSEYHSNGRQTPDLFVIKDDNTN